MRPLLVHHVIAAAEILVDQRDLGGSRSMALSPAQAPFQHRISCRPAVEIGAQNGNLVQRRAYLGSARKSRPGAPGARVLLCDARQFAAEAFGQLHPITAQTLVLHDAKAGCHTASTAH